MRGSFHVWQLADTACGVYPRLMANGSTTRKHYAIGYQAAMLDVARAFTESPERAFQWVNDNMRPETRQEFDARPTL